jgi:anti-sigma-K factor RskA
MAELPLTSEQREALVAELALGILSSAERAEALQLCMADPGFTPGMIDAWRDRLDPLFEEYAPVTPPDKIWDSIATRLAYSNHGGRELRAWRGGALAATAIAASLALILLFPPSPPIPAQRPVSPPAQFALAQLVGKPDGPEVTARYDAERRILSLRATGIKADGLAPELWVIPADGKPRSLGLIGPEGDSLVKIDSHAQPFITDGSILAITMEKAATAPHAAPGSAPVATGKIVKI